MNGQSKEVFLICTEDNHNKFYDMYDNGDGTFTAHWGRIGTIGQSKEYSMSKWYDIYFQKEDKGYREVNYSYGKYNRQDDLR